MLHPPRLPPGKLAASLAQTFLSNPTGRFGAQQGNRFTSRSDVEKLTAACAWCMEPASAVAALAHCASSANGRATLPRNRARSVSSCILWPLVRLLCSGEIGAGGFIGGRGFICWLPTSVSVEWDVGIFPVAH